jgi:hypothetical protein
MRIIWTNLTGESRKKHELSIRIGRTRPRGVTGWVSIFRLLELLFLLQVGGKPFYVVFLLSIIKIVMIIQATDLNILLKKSILEIMHQHFLVITESIHFLRKVVGNFFEELLLPGCETQA